MLQNIKTPTLLLDKQKVLNNIRFMAGKAIKHSLIFRPHFKTHQSAGIGQWFKNVGVEKITVSSVGMAYYFAQNGWEDITIAFPFNIRELEDIEKLAANSKINILLSSLETAQFLVKKLKQAVNYFIKIDTGYHRSGINPQEIIRIQQILDTAKHNSSLQFAGFLAHFGNTYQAANGQEVLGVFNKGRQQLAKLKRQFINDYPNLLVSVGDTPSCTVSDSFEGIDEIRPGNFVFYDLMQWNIGICDKNKISVAMACPVVDTYPERGELLIYGGAIHFSKEYIVDKQGNKSFGSIAILKGSAWSSGPNDAYLKSLSQEHGVVKASKSFIESIKIGDLLAVLPVHSCLTANLMKSFHPFGGSTIKLWDGT